MNRITHYGRHFLVCLTMLCGIGLGWLAGALAQTQSDHRITPPPGSETPEIRALIDKACVEVQGGKSLSEILTDSRFMPAHAYPRFRELIEKHATSGVLRVSAEREPGERLQVRGTVRDAQGKPVANALMYVYHTSAKGWYSDKAAHISGNSGDTRHARLFGYLCTNDQGEYEYQTIRPASYPNTDLPQHIHVLVKKPEYQELWTEIQFDDDVKLTPQHREESKRAGFVICPVRKETGIHHVVADFQLKQRSP